MVSVVMKLSSTFLHTSLHTSPSFFLCATHYLFLSYSFQFTRSFYAFFLLFSSSLLSLQLSPLSFIHSFIHPFINNKQ
ncbi:hypothetical protein BKA57DRAFT_458649 [Linnemannia elongata]|nr:hypothetical protein BKA57DRAFT_458649 [Linnemannia elongata]